jgi:hypothetical protein
MKFLEWCGATPVAAAVAAQVAPNVAEHINTVTDTFRTQFLASSLLAKIQAMDKSKELPVKMIKKILTASKLSPEDQQIILKELGLEKKKSTINCMKFLEWCGATPVAAAVAAQVAPNVAEHNNTVTDTFRTQFPASSKFSSKGIAKAAAPEHAQIATPGNDLICKKFRQMFSSSKVSNKMQQMDSNKNLSPAVLVKLLATCGLKPNEQMVILNTLGVTKKTGGIQCGKFLEWCEK